MKYAKKYAKPLVERIVYNGKVIDRESAINSLLYTRKTDKSQPAKEIIKARKDGTKYVANVYPVTKQRTGVSLFDAMQATATVERLTFEQSAATATTAIAKQDTAIYFNAMNHLIGSKALKLLNRWNIAIDKKYMPDMVQDCMVYTWLELSQFKQLDHKTVVTIVDRQGQEFDTINHTIYDTWYELGTFSNKLLFSVLVTRVANALKTQIFKADNTNHTLSIEAIVQSNSATDLLSVIDTRLTQIENRGGYSDTHNKLQQVLTKGQYKLLLAIVQSGTITRGKLYQSLKQAIRNACIQPEVLREYLKDTSDFISSEKLEKCDRVVLASLLLKLS